MSVVGHSFINHDDIRNGNFLVQQDMALDCDSGADLWGDHCWSFMGRSQEGTEELIMGFINWLKKILSYDPAAYQPPHGRSSQMDEGDFRSGPEGYSPGTAYPDSFYGSRGASADTDDHDEGDFNR
jgi:hypothetical protein